MRWHGDILESPRRLVAIKRVGLVGKFSNEHREAAAVIVVAPSHAHGAERLPFTVQRDAADHGLVSERPVPIIGLEIIGSGVIPYAQIRPTAFTVTTPPYPQHD